jgi:hypothetical protein
MYDGICSFLTYVIYMIFILNARNVLRSLEC